MVESTRTSSILYTFLEQTAHRMSSGPAVLAAGRPAACTASGGGCGVAVGAGVLWLLEWLKVLPRICTRVCDAGAGAGVVAGVMAIEGTAGGGTKDIVPGRPDRLGAVTGAVIGADDGMNGVADTEIAALDIGGVENGFWTRGPKDMEGAAAGAGGVVESEKARGRGVS